MGKLAEILGKITEIVYLSVLWIVFSLPIFTIGASTTALYHTVTKTFLDDRGYITREFVNSFKSNFKQSTIVWLIVALVLVILLGEFWFLRIYVSDEYYDVLLVVLLYLAINLAMFVNCLFPSIARFQTTIKQLYKNCIIIITYSSYKIPFFYFQINHQ